MPGHYNQGDKVNAKILAKHTNQDFLNEAESERLVSAYIKFKSRYIPEIDYKKPETFAYFGSAKRYYEDSIKGIYGSYPYDGSKAEKMEWAVSASFLDLYFLEHAYPKAKGHIDFGASTDVISSIPASRYPETDNVQYIKFTGGPHIGTVYDTSNNREGNLKIDGTKGNTVEFWLKKEPGTYRSSLEREVIFDIHTDDFPSTETEYGRITVELENPSLAGSSPLRLTYLSGTTGITAEPLGANVTTTTVADGEWHHYAITCLVSGTNTYYKLYIDGVFNDSLSVAHVIGPVDRPMIGTIGALATESVGFGGEIGRGKLEGALDEIRFWKTARTEKEIGRFWYSPVHGGTDKDHTNANLGLYYKFNEGITGVEIHDKVVLDYSGRIGNGEIVGWANGLRVATSGIEQSKNLPETGFIEIGDPIINPANQLVVNVLQEYKDKGQVHDGSNMASLANSVPSFLHDMDQQQLFGDLLQIMASSFDNIFLKIKNLPKMKDYAHQEFFKESGQYRNSLSNNFLFGCEDTYLFEFTGNYTKPWVNHILQNFGLVTTEIFPDASLFEMFFERSEQLSFEHSLAEVRNTILSNIHKNLIHIFKTKGTEQSFRNLIRCFGIDQELVRLNAYGKREEFPIELKPVYGTLKQKSANFTGQNYQGTVHNTASSVATDELIYIPAESGKKPLTLSSNLFFPKRTTELQSEVKKVSLFGMHSVQGASSTDSPLTFAASDDASVQVYFNKRQKYSTDGYFVLASTNGTFTAVSSSLIPAVYDNTHWNIAMRVGNRSDTSFEKITPSAGNEYYVELIGHEYQLDVLKNSFHISSSITAAEYLSLSTQDKGMYLGAHKTNFSGSVLDSTDIRSFNLTAWRDIIETEELKEYAKNPGFFGRKDPNRISDFDNGENLKRSEALVFRWQFENLTGSNSSNQMNIVDYSGQAGFHTITDKKYPALAIDMVQSSKAIEQEFLPVVEYNPIDNLHTSDRVKVKTQEINKFEADSRPVTYFYNFEKSMYQVISLEMINMFAGLVGYNNLIGEPVNKYRQSYKSLEKLRERFFRKVQNDIDLDKFVEYYRWIDYSLSNFLNQLVPATSDFEQGIKNVIESHTLERNKYQHKIPTIRLKDEDITGTAVSIGEAGYNWGLPNDWRENQAIASIDMSSDAAIEVGHDSELTHHNSPDTPFAISFWINLNTTSSGEQTLLSKTGEYKVAVNDRDVKFTLFSDASNYTQISASNILTTDWTSLVVTYDGTLDEVSASATPRKIYVNGSAASTGIVTSGSYTGMSGSASTLIIGADDVAGTNNFNGNMADIIMVTGSELTATQALEFHTGGRNYDATAHSRYSNFVAWWKMGDDADLATGSGSIQDYVGTHNGTPSSASIDTEIVVYKHFEDITTDDVRYNLHRTIQKDIPGAVSSTRWVTQPYAFDSSVNVDLHTGINKTSHNPFVSLDKVNKGQQIVITKDEMIELEARLDSELPFTFTSASNGTYEGSIQRNYPITNNHLDISLTNEVSLQGLFAAKHNGGLPHRNVRFGTADTERPEAYSLTVTDNEVTMSGTPINKPKSMFFRDTSGTRFMNFGNIKKNDSLSVVGNYEKDYEIIFTNGRVSNNKYIVETSGSWLTESAVNSSHINDVVDFSVPERTRAEYVITNRFSSPGGPETTALTRDRETEEHSVYNTINYRNLVARTAKNILSKERADQFGYRSGSALQGSPHGTNRNPNRFILGTQEAVRYDNEFVTHQIPQSDYQYSWVTKSVDDTVYDFLQRNDNMPYVSNFVLRHREYNKDFSQETSGTLPAGWSTIRSEQTASYMRVTGYDRLEVTASAGVLDAPGADLASAAGILVAENRIYKSSSAGYNLQFSNIQTRNGIDSVAINETGDLVSVITRYPTARTLSAASASIDVYRSSSAGWALETELTGALFAKTSNQIKAHFFSGSSIVYADPSDASTKGEIHWYASSSSGWVKNVTSGLTSFVDPDVNMSYDVSSNVAAVHLLSQLRYITYNTSSTTWEFTGSTINTNQGTSGDIRSVAYNGTFTAIGRPGDATAYAGQPNANGVVNIHFEAGGSLTLESPVKDFADGFGQSLAISGNLLAVGSPRYDLTTGIQETADVENDKGAVFIYRIDRTQPTASWSVHQSTLYDTRPNPHNNSYFGESLGFVSTELAIESPGEGDINIASLDDYSTFVNLYSLENLSSPVDHSLSGSIISGSTGQALLMIGDTILSPEIPEFPSLYFTRSGDKYRIFETNTTIGAGQPEFIIQVDVIEGSSNVSDSSNSIYGLDTTPSSNEKLLLQYKIGQGNWITSDVIIQGSGVTGSYSQSNFVSYKTRTIYNNKLENVNVRLISNAESSTSKFWGIKKLSLNNTSYSTKSSNKLVTLNTFRKSPVKSNQVIVDALQFTNMYASQLTNLTGASPLGVRAGDHDSSLYWNNGSGDLARSLQVWIKPKSITIPNNTVSQIVTYSDDQQNAKSFARGWSLQGTHVSGTIKLKMRLNSVAQQYNVELSEGLAMDKWYHVCITYDGQEAQTLDGLKIYIDGEKKSIVSNRPTAVTNYTGMSGSVDYRIVLGHSSNQLNTPNSFVGNMNNLAIFDKELTSTEVSELYGLINNTSENYSLLSDPIKTRSSSVSSNIIAYWPFNGSSKRIDSGTGFAIYTDIISGYELVGEDLKTNTATNFERIAPGIEQVAINNVIGYNQVYDIQNYNTVVNQNNNDYLKNTLSHYGHASWQQFRASENPVLRKQRKDNKLTISVRGQEVFPSAVSSYYHDQNRDLTEASNILNPTKTTSRTTEVYDEVMLSRKYQPLTITVHTNIDQGLLEQPGDEIRIVGQEVMGEYWDDNETLSTVYSQGSDVGDSRLLVMRVTAPNDLSLFSNQDLNNKLELDEHKRHNVSQIVQGMNQVAASDGSSIEISYKETVYPREVNTFTQKVRSRINFDFYSWRNLRADRELTLSGSNTYGDTLVNIGNTKVFPDITVDKYNYKNSNEFFVDSRNITDRFSSSSTVDNLVVSRWPLDSRKDFSSLPADLRKSYFLQGDLALLEAEIGEDGAGVLQNDYSIFGLGYNGLYGTPPASAIYSRRIPQASGSTEYLAGEAKWQAADQSGIKPYENSDEVTEKLRALWQDHSLVPEYKVSEFVEDIVLNQASDFSKVKDKSNYLSIEGALYNSSSQEVSVGTNFFKTYGTSDFMKYFGMTLEEVRANRLGGIGQLTLKCNAAIKFTPYRGFYPAERTLQIGELFSRGYMPEYSFVDERKTAADRTQVTSPDKMLNRKIRANLQQTMKPLMAPGILYNSIKSGMAVDYPIFGSAADDAALNTFNTAIKAQIEPMTQFHTASLASVGSFTGSMVNDTVDAGIPRLSGSVSRRVTFEDLLDPQRIIGTKVYDNEPHPSASIYYGDRAITKVFDYPFQFGKLDDNNNQSKLFANNFSLDKTLDDTLTPYKMAINNFCAETVNFFLEQGSLASLESDQVNPSFVSGTAYKMRVYVKNNGLKMYDRHSAFGPPVAEGPGLTFTQISGSPSTNPGQGSFARFRDASVTIAAADIGTTNFVIEDVSGTTTKIEFVSSKPGGTTDITTGTYGPNNGTSYDVSQYGKVYVVAATSSIDLTEMESSSKTPEEAINRLMEVAVNYHRWNSNIDIEANLINGNIRLRQLTTGSSGDTTITATGNMTSLYPSFPSAFVSGSGSTTDFTAVTTSQVTSDTSHEFAPFVPPYLDSGAEPYVEISFTPSETRKYSLEEILQESEYSYRNFKDTPSNSGSNTNYKNAMSVSASLDLKNFVAYKEGDVDTGTTLEQRKRWIIQTKWETPVLNFKNVSVDALNLSNSTVQSVTGSPWQTRTWNQYLTKSVLIQTSNYLTASTGMWHQYGSLLSSNEGYTVSISPIEGLPPEQQLAKKVGFLGEDMKPVSVTPGKLAEKKEISEAVVAIPFYVNQKGDKINFFTVKNKIIKEATKINQTNKESYLEAVHGVSSLSGQYKEAREEYLDFFNNPGATANESIAYQIRMMEKFVFPPQFDYYTYADLSQKPMMYIFQFNAEFTKQDLANIWQNLSPQSTKAAASPRNSSVYNPQVNGIRQDVQYVSNFLTKKHMPFSQRKAFFENDVRWLIFKVKQRGEQDLSKVKIDSLPGSKKNLMVDFARTSIKTPSYLEDKAYSYNWPYDYFSLVELIKVEGKTRFFPFGDDGT